MQLRDQIFFYQGTTGLKVARGAGTSNSVVITGDRNILIDPGESVKKTYKNLKKRMNLDGIDMSKIDLVLFTHAHFDHSNAVYRVKKDSNCKVWCHPHDLGSFQTHKAEYSRTFGGLKDYPDIFGPIPIKIATFFMEIFMGKRKSVKIDDTIENGRIINNGNYAIEAIYTPGHSIGHVSYYIKELQLLIAGDIIDKELDEIYEIGGALNNLESSYTSIVKSIKRLKKLDIKTYISGHGDVINGKEAVSDFLDRNYEITINKPDKIFSFIEQKAASIKDIFKYLYSGIPYSQSHLKKIEILLLLKNLEEKGKIKETRQGFRRKRLWTAI